MTTTFTGPHHGPWGVDETFTKVVLKSTETNGQVWGVCPTYVPTNIWRGGPITHTPTTTWTPPVGVASRVTLGDRDGFMRPAHRPGVTPVPFPKSAPDRIGPFTVDEVREAAHADCPWWINKDGFAQWVSAVLRRLYSEGK